MAFDIKQMDASVVGSTVVLDETELSVQTKDLATVDSETAIDTVLGVKDGEVVQTTLDIINNQLCNNTVESDEISKVLCVADDYSDVYQTSPIDVVNYGLQAGARPSWMPSPISIVSYALSANTSYTFSVANSTKAVAFLVGANVNNMNITLINVTGSGGVSTTAFNDSSATSPIALANAGTRKLGITINANASQICFLVFSGSVVKD